jgi:hypothetical protein
MNPAYARVRAERNELSSQRISFRGKSKVGPKLSARGDSAEPLSLIRRRGVSVAPVAHDPASVRSHNALYIKIVAGVHETETLSHRNTSSTNVIARAPSRALCSSDRIVLLTDLRRSTASDSCTNLRRTKAGHRAESSTIAFDRFKSSAVQKFRPPGANTTKL